MGGSGASAGSAAWTRPAKPISRSDPDVARTRVASRISNARRRRPSGRGTQCPGAAACKKLRSFIGRPPTSIDRGTSSSHFSGEFAFDRLRRSPYFKMREFWKKWNTRLPRWL